MEFKRSIEMRNASSTVYGNVEYDEDDELYGFDMDDDMVSIYRIALHTSLIEQCIHVFI